MMDPTIGRWLTEDPEGFAAGDADLYRYVGNDPTNATDPTGTVIAFTDAKKAKQFLSDLDYFKAKFVTTVKGENGIYVITDPRDSAALFDYADTKWDEVFDKDKGFAFDDKLRKVAARRNRFLLAAGVAGVDPNSWSDSDGNAVPVNEADLALIKKETDKLKGIKEANPPLIIDIGGEGTDHPGALNVNVGGSRNGQPIPRLVARLTGDGPLPFPDGSVNKVISESTLGTLSDKVFEATAKEIARVLAPNGTVYWRDADPEDAQSTAKLFSRMGVLIRLIPDHKYTPRSDRFKEITVNGTKQKAIELVIEPE